MQNLISLQKLYHHKLTKDTSIDQPHSESASLAYLQQLPYETVPSKTVLGVGAISRATVNGSTITDGEIRKDQQLPPNSISNIKKNDNEKSQSYNSSNKGSSKECRMLGIVNTISGSIPATGFPIDSLTATKTYSNAADGSVGQLNISTGSDQNAGINNCLNLRKLNGIEQQRQKNILCQQQQTTLQHHDFKQTVTMGDLTTCRRQHACSSLKRNPHGYLWIMTPVAASISVAIVIAALAGPQWLFTEEKLQNILHNGTASFDVADDGAFVMRYTKSSLWIICTTLQGVETYNCAKIDYFTENGYQPDPHDSSSAIPYTVTKSCPFFLASGIVLLLSFIVFLIPTCSRQNNSYYFSAGIMFIVSGLFMLIGLIAYISILKTEIGSKSRPRSTLQPPVFKFTYGQSFFLFVLGFIATEVVGLLNIFLYTSLQEVGYYSQLQYYTISNLQEKIKEGEIRFNSHAYKSHKHETTNKKPLESLRKQHNKRHQVTAQELELNTKKLLKSMTQRSGKRYGEVAETRAGRIGEDTSSGAYACRKHPNAMSSTVVLNEMDRRYYFGSARTSSTRSNCNVHSRNLAKSLNELSTEAPSPSALLPTLPQPSPMPASGFQLQRKTLPRPPQKFSDSLGEFPLTRSVSTTTDIYATENINISDMSATRPKSGNNNRSDATSARFNTDTERQTNGGGATIQPRNSNKNLSQELNLTTRAHAKKFDLAGGSIDTYNHHSHNKYHLGDDDEEADEEQPPKLCGLKRRMRKTKDELFEEFCKRAVIRLQSKNMYYIDNRESDEDLTNADENTTKQSAEIDKEMQRKHVQLNSVRNGSPDQKRSEISRNTAEQHTTEYRAGRHNPHMFDGTLQVVDMDEEMDDYGFKNLNETDESLYIIDDNVLNIPQFIRSGRRASSYLEPNHLRRLNSNLSLNAIYAATGTRESLQKSTYDLSTGGSEFSSDQHPKPQQTHCSVPDSTYGGSQQRLTFLKCNADSQDSLTSTSFNASTTQLRSVCSTSQQRLTKLMMQHQQKLQQQNCNSNFSREQELNTSRCGVYKSNEELNRRFIQQQQPIYVQRHRLQQYQQQKQKSTSYKTVSSSIKQAPLVQWPAAIPSSPSNFSGSFRLFHPVVNNSAQNNDNNHTPLTRSNSSAAAVTAASQQVVAKGSTAGNQGPPKFQRAYAFDEQRHPSAVLAEAFDFDEIERERERRISHASLFNVSSNDVVMEGVMCGTANKNQEHYDMINGTAV